MSFSNGLVIAPPAAASSPSDAALTTLSGSSKLASKVPIEKKIRTYERFDHDLRSDIFDQDNENDSDNDNGNDANYNITTPVDADTATTSVFADGANEQLDESPGLNDEGIVKMCRLMCVLAGIIIFLILLVFAAIIGAVVRLCKFVMAL